MMKNIQAFLFKEIQELKVVMKPSAIRTRMCVRYYQPPTKFGLIDNFPSDGGVFNEKISMEHEMDYKTPYEKSRYNIHNKDRIDTESVEIEYWRYYAPDPIVRLLNLGLLRPEDKNNLQKIDIAKKLALKTYNLDCGNEHPTIICNENSVLAELFNLDPMKTLDEDYIRNDENYERKFYPQTIVDYNCGDNTEFLYFESFDLYSYPQAMATLVESEYLLEAIAQENVKNGYVKMIKGESNFWKALDDSHDSTSIIKVQNHLHDQRPLDFRLRNLYAPFKTNEKGEVIDILPYTTEKPR